MGIIKRLISVIKMKDEIGSFLMKSLLRINGARIGRNTYISMSARIVGNKVVIGNDTRILSNVKIKANSIEIGNMCILSEEGFYTGTANLKIGNKTYIGKKVRINISRDVHIGNDVGVGENTTVWTHGYFPPADEGYPVTYKPVSILDNAWVSTNIIVLPGVTIGKGTIVGAGAVVTKAFPDNSLIAGNPAKLLKEASQIKSDRGFLEIMKDIFAYDASYVLEENEISYLKYKMGGNSVYVFYGSSDFDFSSIDKNKSIVIFKNILNPEYFLDNKYDWIDLTLAKRLVRNTNNKEVKKLLVLLRHWGVRVEVDYE